MKQAHGTPDSLIRANFDESNIQLRQVSDDTTIFLNEFTGTSSKDQETAQGGQVHSQIHQSQMDSITKIRRRATMGTEKRPTHQISMRSKTQLPTKTPQNKKPSLQVFSLDESDETELTKHVVEPYDFNTSKKK